MNNVVIRSARVLGEAPRLTGSGWRMVGQDGGQSIPIAGGSLFVFADTLLAPSDAPPQAGTRELIRGRTGIFLGNCAGIAPAGQSLCDAMRSLRYFVDEVERPREFLETTALERLAGWRLWPQHGLLVGGQVYLFYIAIRQTAGGDLWSYAHQGVGLAVLDTATGVCRRTLHEGDWRMWPSLPTTVHLGVQVLRADGWAYVFASRQDGLLFRAFVSRVREDSMADTSAYEFLLSGSSEIPSWGADWPESRTLGECGREFSVSWNAHLGGYLMVYLDPYQHRLWMRVAEHPWGPYSTPQAVTGKVPCDPRTELVSLGFEHPQYASEGGRELAISYSQPRFLQNTLLSVRLG